MRQLCQQLPQPAAHIMFSPASISYRTTSSISRLQRVVVTDVNCDTPTFRRDGWCHAFRHGHCNSYKKRENRHTFVVMFLRSMATTTTQQARLLPKTFHSWLGSVARHCTPRKMMKEVASDVCRNHQMNSALYGWIIALTPLAAGRLRRPRFIGVSLYHRNPIVAFCNTREKRRATSHGTRMSTGEDQEPQRR